MKVLNRVRPGLPRYACLGWGLAVALAFPGIGVRAQLEIAEESPPTGPYVGLVLGVGSVPGTFYGGCSDYFYGGGRNYPPGDRNESVFGGVVIGLSLGRFQLEARNLSRIEQGGFDCILLEPVFESGVHTRHIPLAESGTKSSSDVRIGFGIPFRLPIVLSAGAGWVWGNEIPYVTSGLGIRTKGRYQLAVDLLWEMYRMPFQLTDEEWRDFQRTRIVRTYGDDDWQDGWSLQFGVVAYLR